MYISSFSPVRFEGRKSENGNSRSGSESPEQSLSDGSPPLDFLMGAPSVNSSPSAGTPSVVPSSSSSDSLEMTDYQNALARIKEQLGESRETGVLARAIDKLQKERTKREAYQGKERDLRTLNERRKDEWRGIHGNIQDRVKELETHTYKLSSYNAEWAAHSQDQQARIQQLEEENASLARHQLANSIKGKGGIPAEFALFNRVRRGSPSHRSAESSGSISRSTSQGSSQGREIERPDSPRPDS